MAILKKYKKQPADRLDFDFDYSVWLEVNDEILSAVVTAEDLSEVASLTPVVVESTVVLPTFIKVWLSGGAAGDISKITCTVTTSRDRIKQDEIKIKVIEY